MLINIHISKDMHQNVILVGTRLLGKQYLSIYLSVCADCLFFLLSLCAWAVISVWAPNISFVRILFHGRTRFCKSSPNVRTSPRTIWSLAHFINQSPQPLQLHFLHHPSFGFFFFFLMNSFTPAVEDISFLSSPPLVTEPHCRKWLVVLIPSASSVNSQQASPCY